MTATSTLEARALRLAARWGLTVDAPLKVTNRRVVLKVASSKGTAVLKVYDQIGSDGESGAINFLRALPPGIGLRVYRVSPLRRAVLMEWLDGPVLTDLTHQGQTEQAEQAMAEVAGKLAKVVFRFPLIYRNSRDFRTRGAYRQAAENAPDHLRSGVIKAADTLDRLIASTNQQTVIHGDFHFRNTKLTPDGPRIFDAKGFRSDPAAEYRLMIAPFYERSDVATFCRTINRRASLFADATGYDRKRILEWAFVVWGARTVTAAKNGADTHDLLPYQSAFIDLINAT